MIRSSIPKNTSLLQWTRHAIEKMRFYGLSEARIKRVLENPARREEGIAKDTIACMQRTGSAKRPTEIWVMCQKKKSHVVISVWRYPGKTKPRDPVPIPDESFAFLHT